MHRFPAWWLRQADCIHRHESVDWRRAGVDWRGQPSPYFGGYQFLLSTWRSAGGRVAYDSRGRLIAGPHTASPAEQTYRAWIVWRRDGGSWREWGTARVCGLR